MALNFPTWLKPVALKIGPLQIRWYALAYMSGFLFGWWYGRVLADRNAPLRPNKEDIDDFISWAIAGVILGGRIGYILFYQTGYYLSHPLEILEVWHGGMSFHGGVIGIIAALVLFAHLRGFSPRRLADIICCAAPVGLFFGRLANFVNGELYGRVTDVPWAVRFPDGGNLPRHPSQLYEAGLEGIILFTALFLMARSARIRERPGILTGTFLAGYALIRIIVEFFREPDVQLGFIFDHFSMGQILSVPMMMLGFCVIGYALTHPRCYPERSEGSDAATDPSLRSG